MGDTRLPLLHCDHPHHHHHHNHQSNNDSYKHAPRRYKHNSRTTERVHHRRESRTKVPLEPTDHAGIFDPIVAKGLQFLNEADFMPEPDVDDTHGSPSTQAIPSAPHATSISNKSVHEIYRQQLNSYMLPLLQSMLSERPTQPHSFIVDYIKREVSEPKLADKEGVSNSPRHAFADKSFQTYKAHVVDPTITPLMQELFETQPARPRRAIFKHAKNKLKQAEDEYAADLIEIDLFDEMALALQTQNFDALERTIRSAQYAKQIGKLDAENKVLARAIKTHKKARQLLNQSIQRSLDALRQTVRQASGAITNLETNIGQSIGLQKRLRQLRRLKSNLSTAIAHAHRRGVSDGDDVMRSALKIIIRVDHFKRQEQREAHCRHQKQALASLSCAIEAVTANKPRAHSMLNFGMHRALTLKCDESAPEMREAAVIIAARQEIASLAEGQSFSFGLVGKIKTQFGRQARQAKVTVAEQRKAQQQLDQALEEADIDFYRSMGYVGSDSEEEEARADVDIESRSHRPKTDFPPGHTQKRHHEKVEALHNGFEHIKTCSSRTSSRSSTSRSGMSCTSTNYSSVSRSSTNQSSHSSNELEGK